MSVPPFDPMLRWWWWKRQPAAGRPTKGADYAREIAVAGGSSRLLILTHTHAACSVFSDRTKGAGSRIEIRTIDSVIAHIASAYHAGLGLPADTAAWVRQREGRLRGARRQRRPLLKRHPMIAASLAQRHPVVICDEHQDSSGDQHAIVMALLEQGARLRVFADPMQKIFRDKMRVGSSPACDWEELTWPGPAFEQLDFPHRWTTGCPQLGQWTLKRANALKGGRDNRSAKRTCRQASASSLQRTKLRETSITSSHVRIGSRLMRLNGARDPFSYLPVTTTPPDPSGAFSTAAFRSGKATPAPGWKSSWMLSIRTSQGDRAALAAAIVAFMGDVGKGFSPSAFGNRFEKEARDGCTGNRRGKPATIQELARFLVADADHRGVAKMLRRLSDLKATDSNFADVEMDCHREFWDAIRLGDFDTADAGFAEITHRRIYSRPKPPEKAISTIHKAKGLECDSVIVMPCDAKTFPDKPDARCLLYVAISRGKRRLLLVVSRISPSPLLTI